jgi:GATA-binding protein
LGSKAKKNKYSARIIAIPVSPEERSSPALFPVSATHNPRLSRSLHLAMSAAHLDLRGGTHARATFPGDLDIANATEPQTGLHVSQTSAPLHIRLQPRHDESNSASSSAGQSLTSASTIDGNLDLSPAEAAVRKGVLRQSYFPAWKNDSGGVEESPEEMQKKDPLATQVWKLYSKAKSQLPNAERMENLTWRMMSMNLRRLELERERQKGWVP